MIQFWPRNLFTQGTVSFPSHIPLYKAAIILSFFAAIAFAAPLSASAGLSGFGRIESDEVKEFEKLKSNIISTMSSCELGAQDTCHGLLDSIASTQLKEDKPTLINIMSMMIKNGPDDSSIIRKKRYDVCLSYIEHVYGKDSKEYLNFLQFATTIFDDLEIVESYMQYAENISRKLKNKVTIIEFNMQKHHDYNRREDFKNADKAMLQVYEALKDLYGEGAEESEVYTGYMATFYDRNKKKAQYEKYTLKYLDYAYKYNPGAVSEISLQLAQYYMNHDVQEKEMQEKAQLVLEKSLLNAKKHDYPLSLLLEILWAAYINQQKYDQAIAVNLELYAYVIDRQYYYQAILAMQNLALTYKDAGNHDKAIEVYLHIVDQCGKLAACPTNEAADSYRRVGDIYFDKKDQVNALRYYKIALKRSEDDGFPNAFKNTRVEQRIALIEKGAQQ